MYDMVKLLGTGTDLERTLPTRRNLVIFSAKTGIKLRHYHTTTVYLKLRWVSLFAVLGYYVTPIDGRLRGFA